jgi:DNA-binding transcriptional regulator YiaG
MEYKSEIFEVIHQSAAAKFEIGAISAVRMREYDEMCLIQEPKPARGTPETAETEPVRSVPAGI